MSTANKVSSTMSRCKSTDWSNARPAPASLTTGDQVPTKVATKTLKPLMRKSVGYTHKPRLPLLAWLIVSLPLIAWDTLYVFLRPCTMPSGKLHSPLWIPYALYGSVDYIYGWPAWNNHNGFTAAQSAMNVPESAMYCWYLYVVGLQVVDWTHKGIRHLKIEGDGVSLAVLFGFSGAVMTVSKSLLYCESSLLEQ